MKYFIITEIIFWSALFIASFVLFFVYRFWFFLRDPKRVIPEGNNIVSPADGIVLYIKEINNKMVPISIKNNENIKLDELMQDSNTDYNLVIGIFMTPFSVHYNRWPFSGRVTKNFYKNSVKNSNMVNALLNFIFNIKPLTINNNYILENERNTVVIENDSIKGAVVQIADKWINKIKNNYQVNDIVTKGAKLGLIRMGSQCDLYLKLNTNYKICVKEKDYVKAGQDVLIKIGEG